MRLWGRVFRGAGRAFVVIGGWVRDAILTAFVLGGLGLISYGAWLTFKPAGFMVGGAGLLAMGVFAEIAGRGPDGPA